MLSRLDAIPDRDRQSDRRIDVMNIINIYDVYGQTPFDAANTALILHA